MLLEAPASELEDLRLPRTEAEAGLEAPVCCESPASELEDVRLPRTEAEADVFMLLVVAS